MQYQTRRKQKGIYFLYGGKKVPLKGSKGAARSDRCLYLLPKPIPGTAQDQAGWEFEQPALVESVPVHEKSQIIPWFHDTHPLWLIPPCATWSIFINPAILGENHYKNFLGHRYFKPNAELSSCTANSSGFETKSRNISSCGWSIMCQPHAPRAPEE